MPKQEEKAIIIPADRLPPQDIEAEQSLLGALLLDKNAILRVLDILKTEDFYRTDHQKIYETIFELFEKNEPIDVLTVSSRLKERNLLDEAGGTAYLTALVNQVPTSSHVKHYAKIVHEKHVLRSLIEASYRIQALAYEGEKGVQKVLDEAEENIFRISQKATAPAFQHIKPDLKEAFERLESLHKGKGKLRGLATGFNFLDQKLAGLQKSDLIILAARPSLGKSALALDIARHAALNEGMAVGVLSLEMAREQVVDRLIAAESTVDLWKLRTGNVREEGEPSDFDLVRDALERLSEAPIYIDDTPSPTIVEIRTRARKLHADTHIGLLIIDYIQLIISESKTDNRVQQMTEISRAIKSLSRELNIPILAISQLSRAVEQREQRVPRLSDLRETGALEQDADVVLFIHRDLQNQENPQAKNIAQIIIAKHRNGPLGRVPLYFTEQYASFRDLAPEELEEVGVGAEEVL